MNTEDNSKAIVKCQYCGKPIEGEPFMATVYINGWQRNLAFCNQEHADCRQMGAEG